jgi:hypothetical protein
MAGWVIPSHAEAPPLVSIALAENRKSGNTGSRKTGAQWAPRFASVRGRGWKSMKVVADLVLLEVEMGASDELSLTIRQFFKDGRYSPLTRMEEVEWLIMIEQFIASGMVVKNEVISIASDWNFSKTLAPLSCT